MEFQAQDFIKFRGLREIQWLGTVLDHECCGESDGYAICPFPLSLSLCRHSSVFYCLTVIDFDPVIYSEPDSIDCSSVDYLYSSIFLITSSIATANHAAYTQRTCNMDVPLSTQCLQMTEISVLQARGFVQGRRLGSDRVACDRVSIDPRVEPVLRQLTNFLSR